MKRVLLTGAGGFIGHHVAKWIMDRTDWTLVGLDSWNPLHKGDRFRICDRMLQCIEEGRYRVVQADLSVPISDQQGRYICGFEAGNACSFDYIINMASDSHVTRSVSDPRQCWTNNTQLILNMLEFARRFGCGKFIQVSTDEVYGDAGWKGAGHAEWDTIKPSNPYSASKAAQEALAISYWRTYETPLIITNTMNVIGERQDPEKFLPMAISKILSGKEISIHGDGDKIASRVWLDVRNMAAALVFILGNVEVDHYRQGTGADLPCRFNIVGETEMNVLELSKLVAKMLGTELSYAVVRGDSERPGYDRRYALDGTKLKNAGFVAPFVFQQTISRVIDWVRDNPEWRMVEKCQDASVGSH